MIIRVGVDDDGFKVGEGLMSEIGQKVGEEFGLVETRDDDGEIWSVKGHRRIIDEDDKRYKNVCGDTSSK